MKEKEFYISPDVLVFKVKVEGIICQSVTGNAIDPGTPDDWGTLL